MVRVVNDKNEFKDLNKHSWNINADFIIENGFPHVDIDKLLTQEIHLLNKENLNIKQVLDVGCGNGWLKDSIPNNLNYIGVDNCKKFISNLSNKSDCFFKLDIEKDYKFSEVKQFQSDIVVCSLTLIETPYLKRAFKNLNLLVKDKGYILIVGLNPVIELYRVSKTLNEFENYLELYKSTSKSLSISKKIRVKGCVSESDYHRILYSPNDYITRAKKNGLELIDFKEGFDNNCQLNQPVYQYFLFKKK